METLKKFFTWLQSQALWIRIVLMVLISAAVVILTCASCGTTRAVVHNGAHGTSTEIKITTANPTTVTASPNVQLGTPKQNGFYLFTVILFLGCGEPFASQFMIEASSQLHARKKLRRVIDKKFSNRKFRCGYEILGCLDFFRK